MAVCEILLSAVITVLFEKLASADLIKLARSAGINSELDKWNNTLLHIQALLVDAGQKHITDKAVDLWLHNLQDLAYDIDDVLDDLATEALRRKLNQESHATTSTSTNKVLKIMIPTCCTNFTPHTIMYGRHMSSKLDEIATKLHNLVDQKNTLGLNTNVNVERSNRTNRRLEETSLVDESKIMGREGDKEALLGKLLGNEPCNQNVSIVSIVGLGGIGKTTLAKVLYNDEKVKDHFKLRAWVCVSEEFDVINISKAIFQAVGGTNQDFANLDLLHVAIKETLSKKRFLIVLDDVWNEDYREWELLQGPFVAGAPGSKIIVTTRKTKVASVMNSSQPYDLKVLSNEKALSLFARNALDEENFDKHPTLKSHGEGIVQKCGRLPLALITLGRVLRAKTEEDEWEEVLNSEIWNLQDGSQILPALKLSYNDLPPHLKQLFAYCSLFPKDYVFDKNKLVLLWMAEGFLNQSNGRKSMESLGREYFGELMSRSFFHTSTHDQSRYIMHDLINDLATSVAGEFFFRLDDKMDVYNKTESFEKFRHVSFIGRGYGAYRKFKEIQRSRSMRTFLPVSLHYYGEGFLLSNSVLHELLPQLQFLKVLSLTNHSITEVPQSIGSLKHLRYLNFSQTGITCLPEQVSDLYNLQSLIVCKCFKLLSLPTSFVKLINLRHLDISHTPQLKKMPLGIGGLTSLQTLPKVIIGGSNGFKISELKDLSDLQGQLLFEWLDKVIDPIQAKDANLQQKKGVDDLRMEWSYGFDDSRNQMIEYEVLKGLRPHHKLRCLVIKFYGGVEFPSWVGDPSFDQLTELVLHGCRRCTHLPSLGHLRSLRKLHVIRMEEVKTLGSELIAPTNSFNDIAFPSLEFLQIRGMQGLERWSTSVVGSGGSFPHLREVVIDDCPRLAEVSIGLIPSLRSFHIEDCCEVVLTSMVGSSSSIVTLTMKKIQGLAQLHGKVLEHLGVVEDLCIRDCDELRCLGDSGSFLVNLRSLRIIGCKNLKSFPHEHLQSLTSLQLLEIIDCPSLDYSFPCGLWPPNLRILRIGCLNKPMSEWGWQNYPTSLVELWLYGKNSGVTSFEKAEDATSSSSSSSSFLLPPSLTWLSIYDFIDVVSISEVLHHLPCLEHLDIKSCPNLRDSPTSDSSSLKVRVYG